MQEESRRALAIKVVVAVSSAGVGLAGPDLAAAATGLSPLLVSGLMALAGRRVPMFRDPAVAAVAVALARERVAVGRAEGAALPDDFAADTVARLAARPDERGSSILYDREAGRALEWDVRNGVIGRLGARHGIPTPVSDVITPLLAAASGTP